MDGSWTGIHMETLHQRQDLVEPCVDLLNTQWPRSRAARLYSLEKSCDDLPYSLVMIDDTCAVIGYCRLAKVISVPSSVLLESVVVPKHLRGRGLGRKLMELAESHAKAQGYNMVYLNTKDKQDFYAHLGYEFCSAVNTLDAQMLETCDCSQAENKSSSHHIKTTNTHCSSGERHGSQSKCQWPDSSSCSPDIQISLSTGTDTSETVRQSGGNPQCQPIWNVPAPPPPPPVPVSIPTTVIYWMKKDIS